MSLLSKLRSIFAGALHRKRAESDIEEEIRDHMARYSDDLVRSGLDPAEATRRARLEFGHVGPLKEDCREARGWRYLDETVQDLRYTARMFRKSPGFAVISILTLGLGIGANTSIFTIVDAWVLKALPYPHAERLMVVSSTDERRKARISTSAADFYDWQSRVTAFDEFAAWNSPLVNLTGAGDPEQLSAVRSTYNFLPLLGAGIELGRGFSQQDDLPGAERVAILGHELWSVRFSRDPNVIGRTVHLDGNACTVIGVLAPDFHLALAGAPQIWTPFALDTKDRAERRARNFSVIARLRPGVTQGAATAEMKTVAGSLAATYPGTNTGRSVRVIDLREEIDRLGTTNAVLMVFGLVGCVLLIACFNVANLVVGRAIGRQKEMAVRLGIGASRLRIMRQLLTENLALFIAAGAVSVLIAMWGVRWIANAIPPEVRPFLRYSGRLSVNAPVLLYTFLIAAAAGIVFGFAPALHCWRLDVNHGLKAGGARSAVGGSRLKSGLVIGEVALALVVLVSSGLLVRGLVRMHQSDPGFDTTRLTTAGIVLSDSRYADNQRVTAFYTDVLQRLSAAPGVRAAAAATLVPYDGNSTLTRYAANDADALPAAPQRLVRFTIVAGDYLGALRLPLLRGRAFTLQDRDGAPSVGIVNYAFAQQEWPGFDPIGRRVRYANALGREFTVVGVVRNVEGQNENDRIVPEIFLPYTQLPTRGMILLVRSDSNDPGAAVRQSVRAVDPAQAVAKMASMNQLMTSQRAQFVITGQVTGCFAALALFLAGLGIYAVMAYSVAARRREFGIRMALGASGGKVVSMVIRQGLKLASLGVVIGLGVAFGVTQLMVFMLYHVSPTDFPTFALTSCLLAVTSVFACYIPARRASRTDPSRALRYE
jgi:putative ABC transport system permease protein